jgi:hypothetical protein
MTDPLPISITITSDAVDYIHEKGGAVMLRSTLKHGCCGGRVELVKAEVGEPGDPALFERFETEGLTLFAERGLTADLGQPITIGLDRLLGMRGLYVEGADARM